MAIHEGIERDVVVARPSVRRRLVYVVLAAQFLIPLAALLGSRAPTRLGFQMYSGEGELAIQVVGSNGHTQTADVNDLLSAGRPDINWVSRLTTEYLCDAYPNAAKVTVTQEYSRGTKAATHTC